MKPEGGAIARRIGANSSRGFINIAQVAGLERNRIILGSRIRRPPVLIDLMCCPSSNESSFIITRSSRRICREIGSELHRLLHLSGRSAGGGDDDDALCTHNPISIMFGALYICTYVQVCTSHHALTDHLYARLFHSSRNKFTSPWLAN